MSTLEELRAAYKDDAEAAWEAACTARTAAWVRFCQSRDTAFAEYLVFCDVAYAAEYANNDVDSAATNAYRAELEKQQKEDNK